MWLEVTGGSSDSSAKISAKKKKGFCGNFCYVLLLTDLEIH
jgi:hypothetical protein